MFGFLKRNTKEIEPVNKGETLNPHQTETHHTLRRDVQLLLHANSVFPGAIDVDRHQWTHVTFYPSSPRYSESAMRLRDLQRRGLLTIEEPLQQTGYNGWTAKVRLNA